MHIDPMSSAQGMQGAFGAQGMQGANPLDAMNPLATGGPDGGPSGPLGQPDASAVQAFSNNLGGGEVAAPYSGGLAGAPEVEIRGSESFFNDAFAEADQGVSPEVGLRAGSNGELDSSDQPLSPEFYESLEGLSPEEAARREEEALGTTGFGSAQPGGYDYSNGPANVDSSSSQGGGEVPDQVEPLSPEFYESLEGLSPEEAARREEEALGTTGFGSADPALSSNNVANPASSEGSNNDQGRVTVEPGSGRFGPEGVPSFTLVAENGDSADIDANRLTELWGEFKNSDQYPNVQTRDLPFPSFFNDEIAMNHSEREAFNKYALEHANNGSSVGSNSSSGVGSFEGDSGNVSGLEPGRGAANPNGIFDDVFGSAVTFPDSSGAVVFPGDQGYSSSGDQAPVPGRGAANPNGIFDDVFGSDQGSVVGGSSSVGIGNQADVGIEEVNNPSGTTDFNIHNDTHTAYVGADELSRLWDQFQQSDQFPELSFGGEAPSFFSDDVFMTFSDENAFKNYVLDQVGFERDYS